MINKNDKGNLRKKLQKEIALTHSDNKPELEQLMRGIYHGTGMNK